MIATNGQVHNQWPNFNLLDFYIWEKVYYEPTPATLEILEEKLTTVLDLLIQFIVLLVW